jgi:hypothetical protein
VRLSEARERLGGQQGQGLARDASTNCYLFAAVPAALVESLAWPPPFPFCRSFLVPTSAATATASEPLGIAQTWECGNTAVALHDWKHALCEF